MTKIAKFFMIFLLWVCLPAAAQQHVRYTISPKNAETVLKEENIRHNVEFLTDPATGGRATGTDGGRKVAVWLSERFREQHLLPLSGAWLHGFRTSGGLFGRNVIGLIPGDATVPHYVVVMAHFDNLGTLEGTFYPGADSNASGVAALVELAGMFGHMKAIRRRYGASLLLVGLDAKEKDMAGAGELWRQLEQQKLKDPVTGKTIGPGDISLVVNIDQVGATLAPLTKGNPNYLMMLSQESSGRRSTLENVNKAQHIDLELAYDYYGSKDFTNLFYRRISDQAVFLEHSIPAVMFTSGITLNNNKPLDDAASLDYAVLRKRIQLMFYYLDKVL